MNKCIICEKVKPRSEFSIEHIIPEALGNKHLILYDAVCKMCNDLLGRKVDCGLTDNAVSQMYRFINQLKGKTDKIPNPFKKGYTEDGKLVVIDDDFKPYYPNISVSIEDIDESNTTIHANGSDFDSLIKAINTKLERKGRRQLTHDEIEKAKKSAVIKVEPSPPLNYSWVIDQNKIEIAVLKIAYELGYLYYGSTYLSDRTAKEIRGILCNYIYCDKEPENVADYVEMLPTEDFINDDDLIIHMFITLPMSNNELGIAIFVDRVFFWGVRFLADNSIASKPISEVFLYERNSFKKN